MHKRAVILVTGLALAGAVPAAAQAVAQAESPPSQPVAEASVEQRPTVVAGSCLSPTYPVMMREARIEGRVVLQFVVDTLGRIEPATINSVNSTHSQFESAARRAVQTCRYRPARNGNRPVRVVVQTPYEFKLAR